MAKVINLNELTKILNSMRIEWGKRDVLFANIIEQTMLTAENMSYDPKEWTPISEGFPKEDLIGEEFLVTVGEKDVGRNFVTTFIWEGADEGWNNGFGWSCEDVIAWMPLPDPYEEEE